MQNGVIAAALAAALMVLAGCEYLGKADSFTADAVGKVCSQPDELRRTEREKLADWGLWAQCVPRGSRYDDFQLVAKAAR